MTTFTQDDLDALADLRIRAAEDPATEEEMREAVRLLQAGTHVIPERNRRLTVTLSTGHTVTLTHEWQPMGMCRHVSLAACRADAERPELVLDAVVEALAIDNLDDAATWMETLANGDDAVNVVAPIEPLAD
jgi:hypothetical protein